VNLKPQDILVLLKIASKHTAGSQSYSLLANELAMSPSEVHAAVKRSAAAGLVRIVNPTTRRVNGEALYRFLIYGVPRSFPVKPGPLVRGMPTAHATLPLSSVIAMQASDVPPVWPDPDGKIQGYEIAPISKSL
jgi:hypothetical protein